MTKSAFDEIREDEYVIAPEAAQYGLLLVNQVEEHAHLQAANIGYIFRDDELTRHGRVIAAEAILVERILQSEKRYGRIVKWAILHHILKTDVLPDFVILIDRNIWSGMDLDARLALVDHELSHCFFATVDNDGVTQKFHQDGSPWWAIRGHDVEEFCGVVQRRGLWNEDLRAMARVMVDNLVGAAEGRTA